MAKFNLEQLYCQYKYDLFDDFLPFMDKFVIDHKLGGFMCNTDRDGTNLNTEKNSWYNGRGLWVYSFLYNEPAKEEKYLDTARKTAQFILKDSPSDDELWNTDYSKDGKPLQPKGIYAGGKYVPAAKEVYGDLFIAEGLAEYGKAVGDEQYRDIAEKILFKCIKIYDRNDYVLNACKVYMGPDATDIPGARILGVWMVILRLSSQLLRQKYDKKIEAVADRCLDAVLNYHYNPEYNLFNEVLCHDLTRPLNEYGSLSYTGHSIEILWMIMDEALRRKDNKLFDKASGLLKYHLGIAWDDEYGGFFRGLKNVDENIWILDKALWLQEEALIGTLIVAEQTGQKWAIDWFNRIFTYVHDKFVLKKHGYALWNPWTDRKGTFKKHYPRIENFHHPRHLMINLLTIKRMLDNGTKFFGDFKT